MNEITTKDTFNSSDKRYLDLLNNAKHKIVSTRVEIIKTATRCQSGLYWWLGEHIIDAQEKQSWGKSIIEHLANDLKRAFPEAKHGFSPRNLWDMRRFYLEYRDLPNLRQAVAEIPWGQNLVILNKVKDQNARLYYVEMTSQLVFI